MGINEINVKSVLQKSRLPDADYVINPYTGCVHGCIYCYARFMKRFTGHREAWGTFIDAKVNAPEVLQKELAKSKTPLQGVVFFSSVTDPYQPAEARYQITRRLLEVLLEHQPSLSILTKSDLILRDLDLLKQFEQCSVGLSLLTTDDDLSHRLEPRTHPPTRRLLALKTLKENGMRTYAFISPFLPGFSDLDRIMAAISSSVNEVGVEAINMRGGNWAGVEAVLKEYEPKSLVRCIQQVKDDQYWNAIEQKAQALAVQSQLDFMGFFKH